MCTGRKKAERNVIGKERIHFTMSEINGNESWPFCILTYDLAKQKENEV